MIQGIVFGILTLTSVCILVTMVFAMVRATMGPTVFDRILALNMVGTKTVLLICVVSFLQGRTDFLDLALLYSLMNFIGMVALLRFVKMKSFCDESETLKEPASPGSNALASPGGEA